MGMALDESVEGLEKLEANAITAYINPALYETISQRGDIYIEFGKDRFGSTGFSIAIKKSASDVTSCGS